jgi:hypothetical protein
MMVFTHYERCRRCWIVGTFYELRVRGHVAWCMVHGAWRMWGKNVYGRTLLFHAVSAWCALAYARQHLSLQAWQRRQIMVV